MEEDIKPETKKRRKYGTGSLVKRGRIWWLYFKKDGKIQGESLKTKSKAEAEKLAKKRLSKEGAERALDEMFGPAVVEFDNEPPPTDIDTPEEVTLTRQEKAYHQQKRNEAQEKARREREWKNPGSSGFTVLFIGVHSGGQEISMTETAQGQNHLLQND